MGTRHVTTIYGTEFDEENLIANIYGQWDGYPSGHGKKIAEFLASKTMCDGLPGVSNTDVEGCANGAGCLAAQLIAHLKESPGSIYMTHGDESTNHGQDFNYIIKADFNSIEIEVLSYGHLIFRGPPSELIEFCEQEEPEDGYLEIK